MVGGDAIISRVAAGEIDFDKCIATTGVMARLRAVARILGPRGLMPSPKLGTLVDGAAITKAIGDMKGGRVEYRSATLCFICMCSLQELDILYPLNLLFRCRIQGLFLLVKELMSHPIYTLNVLFEREDPCYKAHSVGTIQFPSLWYPGGCTEQDECMNNFCRGQHDICKVPLLSMNCQ